MPHRADPTRRTVHSLIALVAALFGLATVVSGGSVALNLGSARALAGNVVPAVVWLNFLSGFAYLAAAWGIWRARRWARPLALAIVAVAAIASLAFVVAVLGGQPWEPRTLGALLLRFGLWAAIAIWLIRATRR